MSSFTLPRKQDVLWMCRLSAVALITEKLVVSQNYFPPPPLNLRDGNTYVSRAGKSPRLSQDLSLIF